MNELYDVKRVAKIFCVTQRTVYRWVEQGKINAIKICGNIRFTQEEVDRLIRGDE